LKSDEIRSKAYNSADGAGALVPFVKELAAQVAEANEKLNIILNPPLMYNTTKIDPAEFDKFPQGGIVTVLEPRATLRDQFAMAAMTGLLNQLNVFDGEVPEMAAKRAYEHADKMLEARKK
jgi:hypothetical protein